MANSTPIALKEKRKKKKEKRTELNIFFIYLILSGLGFLAVLFRLTDVGFKGLRN